MIGTFGAERAAGTYGDGGREGLKHRDARFDLGAVQQDRFDCFWNSVTANALGTEASHQSTMIPPSTGTSTTK